MFKLIHQFSKEWSLADWLLAPIVIPLALLAVFILTLGRSDLRRAVISMYRR